MKHILMLVLVLLSLFVVACSSDTQVPDNVPSQGEQVAEDTREAGNPNQDVEVFDESELEDAFNEW